MKNKKTFFFLFRSSGFENTGRWILTKIRQRRRTLVKIQQPLFSNPLDQKKKKKFFYFLRFLIFQLFKIGF